MVENVVETRIILILLAGCDRALILVSAADARARLVVRAEATTLAMRIESRTGQS